MYIMGYNFLTDSDIIDPIASKISVVSGAQLSNAIFDHMNVLGDGSYPYSEEIPTEWTSSTIMNANFHDNINAGNLDYSTDNLKGVKIKRRIKGTFAWLTLYDISINSVEQLSFTKYDILNQHGQIYEYALVPYLNDDTECAYIIKEVESSLEGVFVCSPSAIVKFYGGLSYGGSSKANKTGVFEPLGSKYPTVISNADIQYYKGSINATAMGYEQLFENDLNRVSNAQYLKSITDFLVDKSTKIIKDWNGNIWLTSVVDDVSVSYNNEVGMGIANVNFNFVEIGSYVSQDDLQENGFINLGFAPENNPIYTPAHSPIPENSSRPSIN